MATDLEKEPVTRYTLQDSTLYSNPSNADQYNCYAYTLGITNSFCIPGQFIGHNLTSTELSTMQVSLLAHYVELDLHTSNFGYTCVGKKATYPTVFRSYYDYICIRKEPRIDNTGYDFHVMKYNKSLSKWLHKPGGTAILKYKYTPNNATMWTNERVLANGTALSPTINYTSDIYYVTFGNTHDFSSSKYIKENYHSGNKHFYKYQYICANCGASGSTYWIRKVCSGPPCPTIQNTGDENE